MKVSDIKYKVAWASLRMDKENHYNDGNGMYQWGCYSNGLGTVKIYVDTRTYLSSDPSKPQYVTTLDYYHDGYNYTRRYDCTFSDRGLMMISAKFIKDVLTNKFQRYEKSNY